MLPLRRRERVSVGLQCCVPPAAADQVEESSCGSTLVPARKHEVPRAFVGAPTHGNFGAEEGSGSN